MARSRVGLSPVTVPKTKDLGGVDRKQQPAQTQPVEKKRAQREVKTGFVASETKPAAPTPAAGDDLAALAMLASKGVFDLNLLKDDVRVQVEALMKLGEGSVAGTQKFEGVYAGMKEKLGEASVVTALEELAEVTNAGSIVEGDDFARHTGEAREQGEQRDWHREWGYSLLSRDNPRFRDGKYLVGWNQEAGQNRSHFMGRQSPSQAKGRFETQLRELVPKMKEVTYAGSGSDAVNLCFDIARRHGLERNKLIDWNNPKSSARPQMAFFDGVYGGGRGDALGMNWERFSAGSKLDLSKYKLPSPTTTKLPVTDPAEIERLVLIENEALTKLRALATDPKDPLGAVFIEPIQGSKGVLCYRPEFMTALRALADELNLPIIADEVLTSGGRTGKFFAFQHYEGFEPDFVTFGKGMQVNGVMSMNRRLPDITLPDGKKQYRSGPGSGVQLSGLTTGEGSPGDFHKAAEVLTALKDDKLIERAAEVGKKLETMLSAAQQKAGKPNDVTVFGCLAGWTPTGYGAVRDTDGGMRRRLLPPLDVTDETLQQVAADMLAQVKA